MHVRSVRADDAPSIAALVRVMGYDDDENLVAQRLSRLGEDPAVLAAEVDGQVVGWVHVYVDQTLYGPPVAQIGGLSVDPAWSRQGVGAGLMEAAERWAGDAGCHAVWIRSGEQRTAAHEFYRACGYELLKTQLVLVKTLVEDVHDPRVAYADVPPSDPNTQ